MRDLMAAEMSQEALRAQIEQADSLFGVVAGEDEPEEEEEEEERRRLQEEEGGVFAICTPSFVARFKFLIYGLSDAVDNCKRKSLLGQTQATAIGGLQI